MSKRIVFAITVVVSTSVWMIVGSASSALGQVQIQNAVIGVSLDAQVDSQGFLGQSIIQNGTAIQTSMSGGSNISDGLFEFDLSSLPADAVVISADLSFRTAGIAADTSPPSLVTFTALTGDGVLTISDQSALGTLVRTEDLNVGGGVLIPNNTDLTFPIDDLGPVNTVLTDIVTTDFLTIRTETENFVTFRVDSLESTDADASPARLSLAYTTSVPEPNAMLLLFAFSPAMLVRRRLRC